MQSYVYFLITGIQSTRTYLQWGMALVSKKYKRIIERFKILNRCTDIKSYNTLGHGLHLIARTHLISKQ